MGRGGSGNEDTRGALIVESGLEHTALRRQPDADADLTARNHCGDEVAPTDGAVAFGKRESRRQRERTRMQGRFDVDLIELKRMHARAVHERGERGAARDHGVGALDREAVGAGPGHGTA